MHFNFGAACAVALAIVSGAQAAGDTTVYRDPDTGFVFSAFSAAYTLTQSIQYRIAVPGNATATAPYDVVLQVVAPNNVGWAALAWGSAMIYNPIAVGWQNGASALVSSRYTTTRTYPQLYTGATYTILKKGTKTNGTHWQYTAKCTGCTTYTGMGSTRVTLNPTAVNRLAFAESSARPQTPSSTSSTFMIHDVHAYWNHDFAGGVNANFAQLVTQNA